MSTDLKWRRGELCSSSSPPHFSTIRHPSQPSLRTHFIYTLVMPPENGATTINKPRTWVNKWAIQNVSEIMGNKDGENPAPGFWWHCVLSACRERQGSSSSSSSTTSTQTHIHCCSDGNCSSMAPTLTLQTSEPII